MEAGFPRVNVIRGRVRKNRSSSHDLALKSTHSYFYNISLITQASPIRYGKGLHKIIGGHFEGLLPQIQNFLTCFSLDVNGSP